jgi:hypothetical protein
MGLKFGYAMIVLNQKAGKTSRFYVKGDGFSNSSKVMLDGLPCDVTTYVNATLLTVALKYGNWPLTAPKSTLIPAAGGATGEVNVTITVQDSGNSTQPTMVPVVVVNEDDLP